MAFFYDGISLQNRRRENMDSLLLWEDGYCVVHAGDS